MLGNAIAPIALAFAVLDLTGSKSDLGFVLAARALPLVLFLLVGGIWADRLKRNQVMVASNVLSGASQAVLAALLLTGTAQVWMLIVLAAANGVSSAFFFPASIGIVPQTVPATMLQTANALLRLGLNTTYDRRRRARRRCSWPRRARARRSPSTRRPTSWARC